MTSQLTGNRAGRGKGKPASCSVRECAGKHYAKGLCRRHYSRTRPSVRKRDPAQKREWDRLSQRRVRGVVHDVYRCPVCRGSFAVTNDGSLFRHKDGPGWCEGSGRIATRLVSSSRGTA